MSEDNNDNVTPLPEKGKQSAAQILKGIKQEFDKQKASEFKNAAMALMKKREEAAALVAQYDSELEALAKSYEKKIS